MTLPILYDSHMHTPLCKHAKGEPEEYAAVAAQRNLKGIIITCHNPGPDGWSPKIRMDMREFEQYVAMVERARQAWHGKVDVRLGLESDYMPGIESWLEKLHNMADFHHLLGSVHPQMTYYKDAHYHNNVLEFQKTYFEHLAMAAESGLFDTLAHPDLIKNVFPSQWQPRQLWDTILHSLDRIAKAGTAMELNTSGLHKQVREMNPSPAILAEMSQRRIPAVLGSDSHEPKRVAADFVKAMDLLEEAGYTEISFFLDRRRQDVPLAAVRESIREEKRLLWFI